MAEVKKSRIFLRRGTDASRLGTVLCEGELGYSTNGQRVFVGDSSTLGGNSLGTTVFLLPATSATDPTADPFTTVETLTAVTDNGRAEVGDLAFVPASSYNLSSFNSGIQAGETEDTTATPADTFGTLYVLSARDGGTGDLTWVVANSGIPVSHLDIPDNSIAGDKIHGGEISGDVTFSGTVTADVLSSDDIHVTNASNVMLSATSTGKIVPASNFTTVTKFVSTSDLSAFHTGIVSIAHELGSVPDIFQVKLQYTGADVGSFSVGHGRTITLSQSATWDVNGLGSWNTSGTDDQTRQVGYWVDETYVYYNLGSSGSVYQIMAGSSNLNTYKDDFKVITTALKFTDI